jgi:hypothetical protein
MPPVQGGGETSGKEWKDKNQSQGDVDNSGVQWCVQHGGDLPFLVDRCAQARRFTIQQVTQALETQGNQDVP